MKKYTPAIGFLIFMALAIGMNIFSAYAINTQSIDLSTIPTLTASAISIAGDGELLRISNGQIDVVPNSYSTTSPIGSGNIINLGAFSNYPNPNGMFNTYATSTASPLLGASFMGTTNNYVQGVFVQNLGTGSNASSDIVLANNLGTATSTSNYFDLGVANTGQIDNDHSLIQPLYSYLYSQSQPLLLGTGIATSTTISAGMTSSSPSLTIDQYGHLITKGGKPALSGCTGVTIDSTANDVVGNVTLPSLAILGSCVVTFSGTYSTAPKCQVTNNGGITLNSIAISATAMTYNVTAALGGGSFTYQCIGSK